MGQMNRRCDGAWRQALIKLRKKDPRWEKCIAMAGGPYGVTKFWDSRLSYTCYTCCRSRYPIVHKSLVLQRFTQVCLQELGGLRAHWLRCR